MAATARKATPAPATPMPAADDGLCWTSARAWQKTTLTVADADADAALAFAAEWEALDAAAAAAADAAEADAAEREADTEDWYVGLQRFWSCSVAFCNDWRCVVFAQSAHFWIAALDASCVSGLVSWLGRRRRGQDARHKGWT